MNLSELRPFLLHEFASEHDLVQAIQEVSSKFTADRSRIGDYLRDPRLTAAYAAFYLTTNIPKLEAVLRWMPAAWVEQLKGCEFVDLGAGPGTFSMAWRLLAPEATGNFTQIETAELMRAQGMALWQGLFPETPLRQLVRWKSEEKHERLLVFGHSANEMGAEQALEYIRQIEPEHILFIEPGTPEFFSEMLKIREHLLSSGHECLYPCPSNAACPMGGTADWCHQFIHVKHDPEVERLTQLVRKDRKLLPLTVHAYSRSFAPEPEDRIVRVRPETKFSLEWEVCSSAAPVNELQRLQIMKRGLSKSELKELSAVLSGAGVEFKVEKRLPEGLRGTVKRVSKS